VALEEKRDILAQNLLYNTAKAGDILLDILIVLSNLLPFPNITIAQVKTAVLYTGNITPGADKLPTCILKMAWPLIKERVLVLYQGCLQLGYYPK
jgi:hypothetical protein